MKRLLTAFLLLSITGDIAASAEGNTLLRVACQRYNTTDFELSQRVVIAEQLSVHRIESTDIVDSYALLDRRGKIWTGHVPFRMRIYKTFLVSDEKTIEQLVEDPLERPADRDIRGIVMDFMGKGSRLIDVFGVETDEPYSKSFFVHSGR